MIHVTCAIILDKDRVLAAQRGRNTHLAGQWEFPGGKVIEGESEEACIIREIREELDIEVRPLGRLTENTRWLSGIVQRTCGLWTGVQPISR